MSFTRTVPAVATRRFSTAQNRSSNRRGPRRRGSLPRCRQNPERRRGARTAMRYDVEQHRRRSHVSRALTRPLDVEESSGVLAKKTSSLATAVSVGRVRAARCRPDRRSPGRFPPTCRRSSTIRRTPAACRCSPGKYTRRAGHRLKTRPRDGLPREAEIGACPVRFSTT